MAPTGTALVHPDALELSELLRPTWPAIDAALRASGVPLCEGDPDPDPDPDPPGGDPDPDPSPGGDPDPQGDPDWKAESRKHERRAKAERKAREDLERKLKEREDADKSDQDKALEKAREDARAEAKAESDKERRQDRLELHVTRIAAKAIKVGDNDARFADPDDAMVYVERAIAKGDIDADDIFDSEGKVQTEALTTALADILESKPHLRANGNGGDGRPRGGADAGKGSGAGKDLEDMSIEDHAKRQGRTK